MEIQMSHSEMLDRVREIQEELKTLRVRISEINKVGGRYLSKGLTSKVTGLRKERNALIEQLST